MDTDIYALKQQIAGLEGRFTEMVVRRYSNALRFAVLREWDELIMRLAKQPAMTMLELQAKAAVLARTLEARPEEINTDSVMALALAIANEASAVKTTS